MPTKFFRAQGCFRPDKSAGYYSGAQFMHYRTIMAAAAIAMLPMSAMAQTASTHAATAESHAAKAAEHASAAKTEGHRGAKAATHHKKAAEHHRLAAKHHEAAAAAATK